MTHKTESPHANRIQNIFVVESRCGILNRFFEDAKKARFVICGETHGSMENWLVYRLLIKTSIFGGFAYELFDSWQRHLRGYAYGKEQKIPITVRQTWKEMVEKRLIDGKVSKEFISFLQWFRSYHKNNRKFHFILFDASSFPGGIATWNVRDQIMAKNLRVAKKESFARKPVLVGTGSLHSQHIPFTMRGERRFPLGYHLKKESLFVRFRYLSGSYFNITKKSFPNRLKKTSAPFLISKDKNGYIISISRSHPIHPVA